MSSPAPKHTTPAHLHGLRVRVTFEAEVPGHYQAGPTAPERIMVKVPGGGLVTIPASLAEVVK